MHESHTDRVASMAGAWSRMTGRVLRSAVEANTAALEAFGPVRHGGRAENGACTDPGTGREANSGTEAEADADGRGRGPGPARAADGPAGPEWTPGGGLAEGRGPGVGAIAYEERGWTTERSVDEYGEIGVGDYVAFSKRLTDGDVRNFAAVSGDTNRLHLDDPFAERTRFGGRIVHGTLVSGLISAALARLPGLTIYISQDLEFTAPVAIGNRVRARVEVVEALGGDRYRLSTVVRDADADRVAVDGEAVVLVDEPPAKDGDGDERGGTDDGED